ncbi:hypothetical protein [Leucobacter aridicollis]
MPMIGAIIMVGRARCESLAKREHAQSPGGAGEADSVAAGV